MAFIPQDAASPFVVMLRLAAGCIAFALLTPAQQTPFIPVTGPNAPHFSTYLFEDSHGALWMGGDEQGTGLRYFDGSRFLDPTHGKFPKALVTGMSEDGDGGIWIATDRGIFAVVHGRVNRILEGSTYWGITAIASNVLLANVTKPGHDPLAEADIVRLSKYRDVWRAEIVAPSDPGIRFTLDPFGNIIYPCQAAVCEVRASDIDDWRPGAYLAVRRYRFATRSKPSMAFRDRRGCLWLRTANEAAYRCHGDANPATLPSTIAGVGGLPMAESRDGLMVIPSFGRIAVGRPGSFQVITAANGYPSAGGILVRPDGAIWLSNANGLFVWPRYLQMEFWTQREGLTGNTFSVLPSGDEAYAIAGDTIMKLDRDRSR